MSLLLSWCEQDKDRFDNLKKAITTHSGLARDALSGKGIDRHLMGLNILSEMSGIKPRPALFTDKGYLVGKKYRLSTSNISLGDSPIFGGFTAMYDDGYGVCYGLMDGSMKFSIASIAVCAAHRCELACGVLECHGCAAPSPQTCKATSSSSFRDGLQQSLIDMQRLCLTRNVVDVGASKL